MTAASTAALILTGIRTGLDVYQQFTEGRITQADLDEYLAALEPQRLAGERIVRRAIERARAKSKDDGGDDPPEPRTKG